LQEIVDLQQKHAWFRSENHWTNGSFVKKNQLRNFQEEIRKVLRWFSKENYKIGDFVNVRITSCTSGTLKGEAVGFEEMN
jgi:tRNA-2-methylthio-N6-dimethylallyladenosine synthase